MVLSHGRTDNHSYSGQIVPALRCLPAMPTQVPQRVSPVAGSKFGGGGFREQPFPFLFRQGACAQPSPPGVESSLPHFTLTPLQRSSHVLDKLHPPGPVQAEISVRGLQLRSHVR